MRPLRIARTLPIRPLAISILLLGSAADAAAQLTLRLADYATMPVTGVPDGVGNDGSLARVNFMREEPGGARRFFVNDLNGPLYILDKETKQFSVYLDFNGSGTKTGLFDKLPITLGFAGGFISFQFDPEYAKNGRFYTIHLEDPKMPGSSVPDNSHFPGLKTGGYTPTPAIETPGDIDREAVLIEWTDTNIANTTFEGTARELMRVQLNTRIHPMGDMIFNPVANRGDADWRVLYVSCGDGGSGEQKTAIRSNPQRLDTLVGKILRIVPDLSEHVDSSTVSENGRYRIPRDNPFASIAGARKEIWAYGLRNPHRLTWDVDPDNRSRNQLIAAVIGLHTWETVVIVHKGTNYGYSQREGTERLTEDNSKEKIPEDDTLPVQVTDTVTHGTVTPTYPVIAYRHAPGGGDAIAGGFVYRGKALPSLRGKYIFGDISTGRVWYADYGEMLAADDGKAETLAAMHDVQIQWDSASADASKQPYPTMFPIVESAYHARGGKDLDLPGIAVVSGTGRADIRFAVDANGELYILSKSDAMIRRVVGATAPSARN
jgi:hypothetical protein